jgi:hypothetical protein
MTEHQPREHAVRCPWHDARHPVMTWNHSGECDACESAMAAAAVLVSSAGVEFAS